MKKPPTRTHHMMLSQWQSVVAETTAQLYPDNPNLTERLIDANDQLVLAAEDVLGYPFSGPVLSDQLPPSTASFATMSDGQLSAFLEQCFYHAAFPPATEMKVATTELVVAPDGTTYPDREYSDEQAWTFFHTTVQNWTWSSIRHPSGKDYKKYSSSQKQTFGVISHQLAQDCKVAIIGDWGTGMDDAQALLLDILIQHQPDAVIHLGDVYYAGTSTETAANYTDIITAAVNSYNQHYHFSPAKQVPFFGIPGNHEYYSYGYPYFDALPGLNSALGSNYLQAASYFCLQVANTGWQFLAMDTGYNDADPANAINPFISGPDLHSGESSWHHDKLDNFDGATILLSHHQLFSANQKINGTASVPGVLDTDYVNKHLYKIFQPYFADKIAAWLWGHEHNFALYQNGVSGLAKGRLLGASAYQEATSHDPYTVNCADFPYLDPTLYRLSNDYGYYNHAYAILDFTGVRSANDAVQATYYEFPSWGSPDQKPPSPASTQIYTESYTRPAALPQPKLQYGQQIDLTNGSLFLGAADKDSNALLDNYPVNVKIMPAGNQSGDVEDSDSVYLVNTSPLLGSNIYLTANGSTGVLTYTNQTGNSAKWSIKKLNGNSGDSIRIGDQIHFKSPAYSSNSLYHNSSNQLVLSASQASNFVIGYGIANPKNNPILYGDQTIRLQIANGNEWYYATNAGPATSNGPTAAMISLHDVVANNGAGPVGLFLYNRTVRESYTLSIGSVTVNLPPFLMNGDIFSLISSETLNNGATSFLTALNTNQVMNYKPTADAILLNMELTVTKVDTSITPYILQNDLIYIHCQAFGQTYYLQTGKNSSGVFAVMDTHPCYCRFDYAEVQ